MEKCGKLWRSKHETAERLGMKGAVHWIRGAGGMAEMRACSACAGDYEDPDRTAWVADEAEDEEREAAGRASKEEFPAQE